MNISLSTSALPGNRSGEFLLSIHPLLLGDHTMVATKRLLNSEPMVSEPMVSELGQAGHHRTALHPSQTLRNRQQIVAELYHGLHRQHNAWLFELPNFRKDLAPGRLVDSVPSNGELMNPLIAGGTTCQHEIQASHGEGQLKPGYGRPTTRQFMAPLSPQGRFPSQLEPWSVPAAFSTRPEDLPSTPTQPGGTLTAQCVPAQVFSSLTSCR